MKSIRTKLLRAAFFIIAILSGTSIGFFVMHLFVVENYRSISDNMISEYRLVDAAGNLIDTYNKVFRNLNTQDSESTKKIQALKDEISQLTTRLDNVSMNADSRTKYTGLKNTIDTVVSEIDTGLSALSSGNVSNATTYYDEANLKYSFVKENGTQLLLTELENANAISGKITTLYTVSATVGLLVLLIMIVGCVLYFVSFSKKLVEPIQKLTTIAEKIAGGDTTVTMSDDLLQQSDEIGSLSKSYSIMIAKLFENITKLDGSNKQLTDASTKLSTNNEELERMNKFMVGRENKMKDLKNLNELLMQKLKEHGITDFPTEKEITVERDGEFEAK